MLRFALALACLLSLLAPVDAQQARIATYNVQAFGSVGSGEWNAAVSVLGRIDADVVGIQEVDGNQDVLFLTTFAAAAGYPHQAVSDTSGTLSGELRNAVFSRHPIVFSESWSSAELSGDPFANDITRDILEVHVQLPGVDEVLGVFVVHLKASSGGTNDFRRAIEIMRLDQAIDAFVAANPSAPFVVLGDFNEDLGDGPFGQSFSSLPGGLPQTYSLGSDVVFPVVYDPFATVQSSGAAIAPATHEDTNNVFLTRDASGRRLDYVFYGGGAQLDGDEVYNSFVDNGFDDLPLGNWLPKAGSALASGTSLLASDHFAVFADLTLPSLAALYPGSDEDFVMETSINGGPLKSGPGMDASSAGAGDVLTIHYYSPLETLSGPGNSAIVVAQPFPAPGTPGVGPLPGMWFDLGGSAVVLHDGLANTSGYQPIVAPVFGNWHAFVIPPGFGGAEVMLQTVIVSSNANNGWIGFSDGQRLDILF